jgi:CHAT domain-containing protein
LPFQALESEQGLLLNYAPLIYVPSLPSLQGLWLRPKQNNPSDKHLLCGVSDFGERAPVLSHTRAEIEQIAAVLPHAEVLFGPSASTQTLEERNQSGQLADYETLHFATHALPNPYTPELSRVLLSDDDLTLSAILHLRLQAKLVTLSCCQAAISDVASGDEITTLARAFLYAQAQSVVASLWPITDQTSSYFMGLFYQAYNEGQTVAQALQLAQQTLQQEGYSAYHWAAFIALGEPV